ncbi:hypothetical protein GOBAR_DD36380 [Gossypium barbadense]|nr:hypothetical protein GOBAR_DD36380 [Gossypium barbadense]
MKPVWHHGCQLETSDNIFKCEICCFLSNGFAYKCPDALTCPGHEHPLLFYNDFYGQCCACGEDIKVAFNCKDCNYSVDPYSKKRSEELVLSLHNLRHSSKEGDHPHPLTFVKKINYYPECTKCGEPCEELALECAEQECNYLVHWKCVKPYGSVYACLIGRDF